MVGRKLRIASFPSSGDRWTLFAVTSPGLKPDTYSVDASTYGLARTDFLVIEGGYRSGPLPAGSHTSVDTQLWSEGDVVELTLNCEARTLRIKSRLVDHTIPDLPEGQTWVPMVGLVFGNTSIEIVP